MQDKRKAKLDFLLYSWLIYSTYIVIIAPYVLYEFGWTTALGFIFLFISLFFYIPLIAGVLGSLFHPAIYGQLFSELGLILLGIIVINIIGVFFWWRKQTIPRAWLLALIGYVAGPGIILSPPISMLWQPKFIGFYFLACLNLCYFLLLLGNYLQKKYWPDNRLANKIRSILKRPCLRV